MPTEHDYNFDEFIPVNQVLNSKPQLGPIPGEQVIPWVVIAIISYVLCQGVFGLGWLPTLLVVVWGCASWWVLTGNEGWRFLSKFHGVPTWKQGGPVQYESLLDQPSSLRKDKRAATCSSKKVRRGRLRCNGG
ncbi:hypothetical protein AB3R30_20840 [Leptolyngbyaceae cyanobacterium UHCC 1019]